MSTNSNNFISSSNIKVEEIIPITYSFNIKFNEYEIIEFNSYLTNKYGHTVTKINYHLSVILFGVYININKENKIKTFSSNSILYNLQNNSLILLKNITPIIPSKRAAHAACKFSDNQIFIYGGSMEENILASDDLWLLEIDQSIFCKWEILKVAGQTPNKRYGHTMNYIEETKKIFLYAGMNQNREILNDFWIMDMSRVYDKKITPQVFDWIRINVDLSYNTFNSNNVVTRAYHSTNINGEFIYVFGGRTEKIEKVIGDEILESFKINIVSDSKYILKPLQISSNIQYQYINSYFFGSLLILFGGENANGLSNKEISVYSFINMKWFNFGEIHIKKNGYAIYYEKNPNEEPKFELILFGGIDKKYTKIEINQIEEKALLKTMSKNQNLKSKDYIKKMKKREKEKSGVLRIDLNKIFKEIPELYAEFLYIVENNLENKDIENLYYSHNDKSKSLYKISDDKDIVLDRISDLKLPRDSNSLSIQSITNNMLMSIRDSSSPKKNHNLNENDTIIDFKYSPRLFTYKHTEIRKSYNIFDTSNRISRESNLFSFNKNEELEEQKINDKDYNNIENNINKDYFSSQIIEGSERRLDFFKSISIEKLSSEGKKIDRNSNKSIFSKKREYNEELVNGILNSYLYKISEYDQEENQVDDNYFKIQDKYLNIYNLNELLSHVINNNLYFLNEKRSYINYNIINLKHPIKIFSNIKGKFNLLLKYFEFYGRPSQFKGDIESFEYLFIGDMFNNKPSVDNIRILILVLCLIVKYPESITMLRSPIKEVKFPDNFYSFEFYLDKIDDDKSSNYELYDINYHSLIVKEMKKNIEILLRSLPLISIINNRICCVHSNIPEDIKLFTEEEIFKKTLLKNQIKTGGNNYIQFEINYFLLQNNFQYIIRSEQDMISNDKGFERVFDGKVISFFSGPEEGCFIIIKKSGELQFKFISNSESMKSSKSNKSDTENNINFIEKKISEL